MDEEQRSRKLLQDIIFYINRPERAIPFQRFMSIVTESYYGSLRQKIGFSGADFYTSPEVSPLFGQMIAQQLVDCWQRMGEPTAFEVVEYGAGTGKLARDILDQLEQNHPATYHATHYRIIEASRDLTKRQQDVLRDHEVGWLRDAASRKMPVSGVILSNELLDAFPVHRVVGGGEGELLEQYVTLTADRQLQLINGPLSTPRLKEYFARLGITIPPGNVAEVNLAALDWLEQVTNFLQRGYVITIDYGYPAHKLYTPARRDGTLLGYYQHTVSYDPFAHLGSQDLTSHVDFTSLQLEGERLGLWTLGFTNQAAFLLSLGLGDELQQLAERGLRDAEYMLQRAAIHKLIEPGGLGSFGVLIQGKGVPNDPPLLGLNLRI